MVDTHGVMAEYHKIYKVMYDNIWASSSIEVFNNVHSRLGGLPTIMNSSGSVGNLWLCRQNAIPDLIKHCKTKLLPPVLARRSCTSGHEGFQDHYHIQKQRREERL